MRFTRLSDWLRWQETLNPHSIDLGLERVRKVAGLMGITQFDCPVVTVGGTNGKGSCVAYLEAILIAAGYRVGSYSSPHILRYNERIRLDGVEVEDIRLCEAFDAVDRFRGDVALTYFEFGTLAALKIFKDAGFDAVVLEVGLGGRLDAVNLVDPDVALVTSIGLDHTDWLGNSRESIGYEKAGIFRSGRPAVCGDASPPQRLISHAHDVGATLYRFGVDFRFDVDSHEQAWDWFGWDSRETHLPLPGLPGRTQILNAANVLAVLRLLRGRLAVGPEALAQGLKNVRLAGRFQVVSKGIPVILDVAHNAEACTVLAENLESLHPVTGRTHAVIGMLRDKPVEDIGRIMDHHVHAWHVGGLDRIPRGLAGAELAQRLGAVHGTLSTHESVAEAFRAARSAARDNDRIVVFGSFHTLESVWEIAHGRGA